MLTFFLKNKLSLVADKTDRLQREMLQHNIIFEKEKKKKVKKYTFVLSRKYGNVPPRGFWTNKQTGKRAKEIHWL
ncbi:MAG: hypothetical protein D3925_10255 [Candidatus Electrothrix sp. AR5]|nr:hypothetical protein [Candidatus Electrothrix sp. AR5]